jgi:D-alanyl-D-alanine carboxypeptidase (penicillin-binding protein 5/6)
VLPLSRPPFKRLAPVPAREAGLLALLLLAATAVHATVKASRTAHEKYLATPARLAHRAGVWLPRRALPQLPFAIGESSGVLWNLTTGQELWAFNPHQVGAYASTTKLMTIDLALHQLPLRRVLTITPQAAGTPGSDIRMAVGQHYTVKQLLYALMLRSANDAAVELAQAMGHGHVTAFVRQMNRQASQLGMRSTHYADPDGLNPNSRGTAWDLTIITEQDLRYPLFRQIVATRETSLPHNPVVKNLNGLLFLDPSVIGVKSGWTTQAGFNLVFAATRSVHGRPVTLLGVIMHGQKGFPPEYQDAEKILNWGFKQVAR